MKVHQLFVVLIAYREKGQFYEERREHLQSEV